MIYMRGVFRRILKRPVEGADLPLSQLPPPPPDTSSYNDTSPLEKPSKRRGIRGALHDFDIPNPRRFFSFMWPWYVVIGLGTLILLIPPYMNPLHGGWGVGLGGVPSLHYHMADIYGTYIHVGKLVSENTLQVMNATLLNNTSQQVNFTSP